MDSRDFPLIVSSYSTGIGHAAREHRIDGHDPLIISLCGLLRGAPRRFTRTDVVTCGLCTAKLARLDLEAARG